MINAQQLREFYAIGYANLVAMEGRMLAKAEQGTKPCTEEWNNISIIQMYLDSLNHLDPANSPCLTGDQILQVIQTISRRLDINIDIYALQGYGDFSLFDFSSQDFY